MKKLILLLFTVLLLGCSSSNKNFVNVSKSLTKVTNTPGPSATVPIKITATKTPVIATNTVVPSDTPLSPTDTAVPSDTPVPNTEVPTNTPIASETQTTYIQPYLNAPACTDHSNTIFHTLWNGQLGCHYDHEHGQNPFTQEVADAFPGFDLKQLIGNVEVGHSNPSSPAENTTKHGGEKWQVNLNVPCEIFESANYCVTDSVLEFHWFGNSAIEMESRVHSLVGLIKECDPNNLSDCGEIFTIQYIDFGQRVSQYQGDLMTYPNNPDPSYDVGLGPYFTIDRFGNCVGCRTSLQFVLDHGANSNATWTSKNTGSHPLFGGQLLQVLIRSRNMYQLLDYTTEFVYPHTFGWLCSSDNGVTFNPAGCRYTNDTATAHELAGVIPAEWDNLAGFDTNPEVNRITAQAFVTQFGQISMSCVPGHIECFPIKLENAFVGKFGAALPGQKISNPSPISNPSRNIWFCGGVVCNETDSGAVPSGWIGQNN